MAENRQLRICMVSEETIVGKNAMIPGGIGQYILRYSESLRDMGHQITVVCRAERSFDSVDEGLRVVGLNCRKVPWNLCLFKWLWRNRFDIVEIPDWGGQGAVAAVFLPRSRGAIVTRGHGHSLFVQRAHGRREVKGRQFYKERVQLHCSDGILANSLYLRGMFTKDFDIKEREIDVCHIGVDPGAVGNVGTVDPQFNGAVLIYVGGLDRRKGPVHLLYILQKMRCRYPMYDTKLMLVGPDTPTGPDGTSYMEYCKTVADELGVSESVQFFGVVPRKQLASLYAQASIFVSGSHTETLGIPFLEAMSMGLPVVTWQRGAAPELIVQGQTGYTIEFGDMEAFAQATASMIVDPVTWQAFSRAARQHVRDNFSESKLLHNQVTWYRDVAAGRARLEK
ncbi:glycosyltransferase family 4 protein [Alicyclobacillus sp. ALC3]|uniref:glycosyltransferase family 4 protein n=1 Tax=Alicyclobacillus sp. ALC3 TaxID=2796143 RepID=UPI002377E7F0|nr:glycosyltransferase family 4 protein [Alicyclobacillus sp. ALC3]WDL95262.1 glycosyltransferase family 4 protein [Alicyclobacillus sp. ALC3]